LKDFHSNSTEARQSQVEYIPVFYDGFSWSEPRFSPKNTPKKERKALEEEEEEEEEEQQQQQQQQQEEEEEEKENNNKRGKKKKKKKKKKKNKAHIEYHLCVVATTVHHFYNWQMNKQS